MDCSSKGDHFTLEERKIIENGIRNGATKTAIAITLGKDNSSVGKEIAKHRIRKYKCALPLECASYKHCKQERKCTIACPNYKPFKCTRRDRSPGACNGCSSYTGCRFDKYYYDADEAHKEYKYTLVDSRQGVDLTFSEAKAIAEAIRDELRHGLSPYTIIRNHPELDICEKTLYNYIESDIFKPFDISVFDLRRQLSRKLPKEKKQEYKKREDRSYLRGRTYSDFKAYMAENPYASVVEMDTVYNDISKGPFIQSFKFLAPTHPFSFGFYHDTKTAQDMLDGVNLLEEILGPELFSRYVNVLLTDRGSEFSAADDIETRSDSACRTRVFYCDPMGSSQKGSLENKHIELRYILPNEVDLRAIGLTGQEPLNLCWSHVNSFAKEKLQGRTEFDCLKFFAPEVFQRFIDYGLSVIPPKEVILNPSLLKPYRKKA